MNTFHFIGIKGSGMSALAQILSDLGHQVQGEDIESFLYTQAPLEARNIPLYPFGEAPLSSTMQVIASNAFDDNHPSIIRCQQLGMAVHRYHHFLGERIKGYTSVAITGAHGKTTTTGMITHALHGCEPVCSLIGDGTGTGVSGARLFVFESCEYKRHFLAYQPDIAVITNIDFDHPDYFKDIDDVRSAFEAMAALTGKQLVVCGDDPQIRMLQTDTNILYYGFGADNDLRATNLIVTNNGTAFDVSYKDKRIHQFDIPSFGKHNVLNALAVIGVALVLDQDMDMVKSRLATFTGVQRRFTEKPWGTNIVIDDYAHHPSEIRATLEAVRSKYPQKKVVGIFQPHTFSRLEKLMDDFALSLQDADDVFLCQIFGSARESAGTVSIDDLRTRIPNARLVSDNITSDMSAYNDSILVFMGAGDIQKYQDVLFRS
ncbi:UDP-N-acetylmuramate--L-alanine ligase [Paenibacillus allorhizosphaerae]|uniref:UDP-N-acetylmuramate--L-alanine ligase n=1 Tax=Paenibacillus allorhizosphaerae TaxID=2849866 RepID=A0ABN7TSW8_9BACL|nr:UDP-N-acetylmuramate--L-alanine ligase [Paenibacillus allorhizosphaerae]CAG7650031.1 UDP-N-acetylmuramate--L-alanine ligase [Paenibacillus allorhizosphaerae]